MGDRANVYVHDGDRVGVYLYTHWSGTELPELVRDALNRKQERWDDDQYLARIIFCRMLDGNCDGTTGYGISAWLGDGDDRIVDVDTSNKVVTLKLNGKPSESWPIHEYIVEPRVWLEHEG